MLSVRYEAWLGPNIHLSSSINRNNVGKKKQKQAAFSSVTCGISHWKIIGKNLNITAVLIHRWAQVECWKWLSNLIWRWHQNAGQQIENTRNENPLPTSRQLSNSLPPPSIVKHFFLLKHFPTRCPHSKCTAPLPLINRPNKSTKSTPPHNNSRPSYLRHSGQAAKQSPHYIRALPKCETNTTKSSARDIQAYICSR